MNKDQIKELVKKELKKRVLNEQEEYIEERASTGIVKRILASIGGWQLGASIGAIPYALAVTAGMGVGIGSGALAAATAIAGGMWFSKEGYKMAVRAGPDVTTETYQELKRITIERDKVLQKLHKIASVWKDPAKQHKHASKLDSLTSWMEKIGKELEQVVHREFRAGKIDQDQYTAMISVSKVAQQGALTYIEDAKTAMSYVEQ